MEGMLDSQFVQCMELGEDPSVIWLMRPTHP